MRRSGFAHATTLGAIVTATLAVDRSVPAAPAMRPPTSLTHIRLTPPRPATAADSARAAAIADTLRQAIARYRDVRVAERDGYAMFLPRVKQRVYHFTSSRRAIRAMFRFDPAAPTSLLYRQEPDGRFVLIGAMYTAPKNASLQELDRRVPLSVARWHAHVNICVPPLGERGRWAETDHGHPRFGPAGTVDTESGCTAAGGRFFPQLFGWMLHANVLYGRDLATVWGGAEGHGAHDMYEMRDMHEGMPAR